MREDMAKVLVERPRIRGGPVRGSKKGYRKATQDGLRSDDGLPNREGIKRRSGGGKHFNEHLGPLRRFLDSRVGRPWAKVHAEILERVDRGNVVQKHILTHLYQYVETEAVLVGRVACYPPHRWGFSHGGTRPITGRFCWFVCPKSGLLKKAPHRTVARPKTEEKKVWLGQFRFCARRAGGEWFYVRLAPVPDVPHWPGAYDAWLGRQIRSAGDEGMVREYRRRAYAVEVRPLKRSELRNYPISVDLYRPPVQNRV